MVKFTIEEIRSVLILCVWGVSWDLDGVICGEIMTGSIFYPSTLIYRLFLGILRVVESPKCDVEGAGWVEQQLCSVASDGAPTTVQKDLATA